MLCFGFGYGCVYIGLIREKNKLYCEKFLREGNYKGEDRNFGSYFKRVIG